MNLDYLNTKDYTMKDLFFIVKGQHRRDYRDKDNDLLGYDPYNPNTSEWYMLIDNKTFTCVSCSSDLQKVLNSAYRIIKRHRGIYSRYCKNISEGSSRPSGHMRAIYEKAYRAFGDYFAEEIGEVENRAYKELLQEKPFRKYQKLKATAISCEVVEPKKVIEVKGTKTIKVTPMKRLKTIKV